MKSLFISLLVVTILIIEVICVKNCSFEHKFRSKVTRVTFHPCENELICCENPETELDVCCNPPEYQLWSSVLPVKLNVRNIVLILVVFFGVIIFGAIFIVVFMAISNALYEQKNLRPKPYIHYDQIIPMPNKKTPIYSANQV